MFEVQAADIFMIIQMHALDLAHEQAVGGGGSFAPALTPLCLRELSAKLRGRGGGSWTIRRDNGTTDSVDINELRAILGIEWGMPDAIRAGRRTGFFEIGYVFNREIKYRYNPDDDIKPGDGMMFRIGIGY